MNRHLPLLMTLALAACGGGGGGGGSPPPTTGSATQPSTMNSAVGQNGNIDGTALKSTGPGPYPLNAVTATLNTGVGPADGGISISDTAAPGTVSVTFDPTTNQITAMTYSQNGTDHELLGLDGTTVANPQSVPQLTKDMISTAVQNFQVNQPVVLGETLQYSSFGVWANAIKTNPPGGPNDGKFAVGVFAAGSPTPTASVPTTGSATYTGDAAGFASMATPAGDPHTNGKMNMAFDANAKVVIGFADRTATTSFTNLQAVSMDSLATKAALPDLTGSGSLTGNAYSTALSGGGLTGGAIGTLNGPAAQETAGTFSAQGGTTTIVGGFAAKR